MTTLTVSLRRLLRRLVYLLQHAVWRALDKLVRGPRLWDLVDAMGIVVFVGPNGSGKSLAMVQAEQATLTGVTWSCRQTEHRHHEPYRRHATRCARCTPTDPCRIGALLIDRYATGRRLVYSTVPLLDHAGDPHPLYRPLIDYRQLVTIEHGDVLFDEVAGVSDASDSASVPVQVVNWLHQLRKRDVRLRVTTPAYSRCSKPIRQVAQLVVDARSFMPELASTSRMWRPRKAMLYRAYDAFEFEDFKASTGQRLSSRAAGAFWRPGSFAESAYDTLGAVLTLGHVTEAGQCAVCGGSRSRPRCACDHSTEDLAVHDLDLVETVSSSGARVRRAVPRAAA
ncbi:MAG TPA: hypothetical protein VHM23_10735 [Actinomycetota bacterium]|nr:hypothetical protein [Actinomycetota bacterium]